MTFAAAPIAQRARVNLSMSVAVLPAVTVASALMYSARTTLVLAMLAGLVTFYLLGTLPRAYSVAGDRLVVHRRGLADKQFTLAGAPERFENTLAIDWRWYGTGWRPAGREWSAKQGLPPRRVYLAVTDRQQAVRVPTEAGTVIVTPAEPDDFVARGRSVGQS
jgi:hypothetical protein